MKYLDYYKNKGISKDKAFEYFVSTMRPSIAGWDYFVNWEKVQKYAAKLHDELNLLNGLIGSSSLEKDFKEKIAKYPSIVLTFPVLLAIREQALEVSELLEGRVNARSFTFHPDAEAMELEDYWEFFKKSGLADLFENRRLKNIPDYVFGVEVGLDTNGRKNRGGDAMENIVEELLRMFCTKHGLRYLREADAKRIKREFNYDVPVDKSSRRYDFVLDLGQAPLIFETNFYGKGGSKLKSTAGEYRNLFDVLDGKFKFVWITDGAGWKTTLRPLEETFGHNDYVFNLFMLEDGVLQDVI